MSFLWVFAALAAAAATAAAETGGAGTRTCAGRVVAGPGGSPVSSADVAVVSVSGGVTRTDAEGRFVIEGLPAGRHTLRVTAEGYRTLVIDVLLPASGRTTIELPLVPATLRHDEHLVVTPSREVRLMADLPAAVSSIGRAELERRLPRSTPEALADLPGVLVQKTNHGSGSPYVRGLLGNQVLVLVDGIRLNNSTFRYGPNQYLATIDPASIERIEVVRGAGSVLYGSDALGGVINIVTRRPEPSGGPWRTRAGVTGKMTSSAMEQSGHVAIESAGPRVAARLGVSARDFGDLRAGGALGLEAPSGYDERAADASMVLRVTDRSVLSLSYQHVRQNDVPRFDQVTQRGFAHYSFDPQVRQLAAANLRHVPGRGPVRSVEATVSFHQSAERREIQRRGSSTQTVEEDTVRALGMSALANFVPWHGWRLTSGVDVYSDRVGSARRETDLATGGSRARRGLYPDGARAHSVAGFLSAGRTIARATIDAGVRYTRNEVSAADATFGTIELSNGAWVSSAGTTWRVSPAVQFVASVSQAFRSPNVDDVSTLGNFDSGVEVPSPGLVPERSLTVEGGVRLEPGSLALSARVFRTNLDDLIDRVRSTFRGSGTYEGQPVFQKANVQRAYVHGVEVEGRWRPREAVTVFGHASYVFGHLPALDQPMRRMPPLNGLLAVRWTRPLDSLWIEGRVRAAAQQTRLSAGDLADHRIAPGGTPGWATLSLGLGRPVGARTELTGAFENVFDRPYRIHGSGIDGAGRHAWIGLRLSF